MPEIMDEPKAAMAEGAVPSQTAVTENTVYQPEDLPSISSLSLEENESSDAPTSRCARPASTENMDIVTPSSSFTEVTDPYLDFDIEEIDTARQKLFSSLYQDFRSIASLYKTDFGRDDWADVIVQAQHTRSDFDNTANETNAALLVTVEVLKYEWKMGPTHRHMNSLTKRLADASRDEMWRVPFFQQGIVDFFLDNVLAETTHDQAPWVTYALRLVGNCCADSLRYGSASATKERVFSKIGFQRLISRLSSKTRYRESVALLYNMCIDYEAAQVEAQQVHDLNPALIRLLNEKWFDDQQLIDSICHMLGWAPNRVRRSNYQAYSVGTLLKVSRKFTITADSMVSLTDALTAISSKNDDYQEKLSQCWHRIDHAEFMNLLTFFLCTYSTTIIDAGSTDVANLVQDVRSQDDEISYSQIRARISQILASFALRSAFAEFYSAFSLEMRTLIEWVSAPFPQIQICALMVLGNSAFTSHNRRVDLIQRSDLPHRLAGAVASTSNDQVLSSAFDVIQNVSTVDSNRAILGKNTVIEALSCCWSEEFSAQIRYKSFYHTRQLLRGSLFNVHRFLALPAVISGIDGQVGSLMKRLLWKFEITNDVVTCVEIGRTTAEIWRTIHAYCSRQGINLDDISLTETTRYNQITTLEQTLSSIHRSSPVEPTPHMIKTSLCQTYDALPHVTKPILTLIKSDNPSLVTEGWFVMSLMSRGREALDAVFCALCQDNTWQLLMNVFAQPDGSKDKSNAFVLVDDLIKQSADNDSYLNVLRPFLMMAKLRPSVDVAEVSPGSDLMD